MTNTIERYRFGLIGGGAVGAIVMGIIGVFFGYGAAFPVTAERGTSVEPSLQDALALMIGGMMAMGLMGFGGGKAIDLKGSVPVGVRVMLGALCGFLVQVIIEYSIMHISAVSYPIRWGPSVAKAIG